MQPQCCKRGAAALLLLGLKYYTTAAYALALICTQSTIISSHANLMPYCCSSTAGGSALSSGDGSTDATCVLATVEQSAKSFSYVPVRKRQVEAAEQAAQAQQAPFQPAPQSRIKYDSISQFSQKVELYRGR